MNLTESPNGRDRPTATQSRSINSSDDRGPRAVQLNGAVRQKCPVCDDPIGENCFCKIHRKEGGPILLCCPSCAVQYLDSARPPADSREEELRAYEKSTHFFIGEDKPWS
jgi:hypothetical protein